MPTQTASTQTSGFPEPITPQKQPKQPTPSNTSGGSPSDAARKAANISWTPPSNKRISLTEKSPSPNGAALLAARAIASPTPSPSAFIHPSDRGWLSRNPSYDAPLFPPLSPGSLGSLLAAQLSVIRNSSVSPGGITRSKSGRDISSSGLHIPNEDVLSSASPANGSLTAAKISASRDRSLPIPVQTTGPSSSLLAAGLAVSRSTTPGIMSTLADQEQHDILPPTGAVLAAKQKLLASTSTGTSRPNGAISASVDPTSNGRPTHPRHARSFSNDDSGRITDNQISSLSAAKVAVQHSNQPTQVPSFSTGTFIPIARQPSPMKRDTNHTTNTYNPISSHTTVVKPIKPIPINPNPLLVSQTFSVLPSLNKNGTMSSTASNAIRSARTATLAQPTAVKVVPPLPKPRGMQTIELDLHEPVKASPPPSQSALGSIVHRQPPSIYQNKLSNSSAATLPAPRPLNTRTTSNKSLQQLQKSFTGPDPSTTAASFVYKNPGPSWRDDLPYNVSPAEEWLRPVHTGDSLRQAVVASSLASSRAPSPVKSNPLPLPPRPTQGLRTTMRKPEKREERTPSPQKKHYLVKKHPNKHSEGSRKRWREVVTEKERKRYEGLWAANRGLYMDDRKLHPDMREDQSGKRLDSDVVVSVVVKDIWGRSRLPLQILEEIYNLVDRGPDPKWWLTREEFIMGLWLIDLSLKGRKLPARIQNGTWESVRRMGVVLKEYHELGLKTKKSRRR